MAAVRPILRILPSRRAVEGDGVEIRRAIPAPGREAVGPFLLLDHFGPVDFAPGAFRGIPDHPHRGFETISYLLEGRLEHRDSLGNTGRLGPGEVQWMTAGSGIVHAEMPDPDFARTGGRLHGFQIWVNLPNARRMTPPRYQHLGAGTLPVVRGDGTTLRVIAGRLGGVAAPIETFSPLLVAHATVEPGASVALEVPEGFEAALYGIGGAARVGDAPRPVAAGETALLGAAGGPVAVAADGSGPADVLLLAGEPIREPLFRYGPFVMGTRDEILEAIADFEAGRMGRIAR